MATKRWHKLIGARIRVTGNIEPDTRGRGGKGDVGRIVAYVSGGGECFPGCPFGVRFDGTPGVFWFSRREFAVLPVGEAA